MAGYEPPIIEGSTITPLKYRLLLDTGSYCDWASGTIQILDKNQVALSTFATPVAVTVSGTGNMFLDWYPVWGTSAGQLPNITVEGVFYARWRGVQTTTTRDKYTEPVEFRIKPR